MRIHKISHCCLVLDTRTKEGQSRRILVDPGFYSLDEHTKVKHIDIILITHEHADHFHLESLKALLREQPEIIVITDIGVGAILEKEGVPHHIMEHGNAIEIKGIHIEAFGKDHAILHSSLPLMSNIGFFIEQRLFFPGDAFTLPGKEVDILALPVAGPWMKISEAIDYALEVQPKHAFPVHDAIGIPTIQQLPHRILNARGIEFILLENGKTIDID